MESAFGNGVWAAKTVAHGIAGGTASKLTGGKLENGAITGAFSRLLNDELPHGGRKATSFAQNMKKG